MAAPIAFDYSKERNVPMFYIERDQFERGASRHSTVKGAMAAIVVDMIVALSHFLDIFINCIFALNNNSALPLAER